jgi:hypothetical protein
MKRLIFALVLCFSYPAFASDAGPAPVAEVTAPADAPADAPAAPDAEVASDATADAPEAPPEDPVKLIGEIYSKMKDGKWLPAVALILILLIWGVQKLAAWKVKWFDSKLGKYLIAFGTAAASSASIALWAGDGLSVGLFTTAVGAALAAAGGFEALSDLFGKKKEG